MKAYKEGLYRWNVAVVVVHWSSFLALLLISVLRLDEARRVGLWFDADRGTTLRGLGTYPLFATLVPFPFITGVFHILAAAGVDRYYQGALAWGINRLRWVEYSVTNGLMTWSLCMLAGAGNPLVALLCVFANFSMQYMGYAHEQRNHRASMRFRTLGPLLVGFIPWIITWATIFTYWGVNQGTDTKLSDGFAIVGSFVWSLTFVLPLVWRYTRENTVDHNYKMERAYILLSLTAKLWLDWTVIIGTLANN